MKRRKQKKETTKLTLTGHLLLYLFAGMDMLPRPFESKTGYVKRLFNGHSSYNSYVNILRNLEERGWITLEKIKRTQIPVLTKTGKLEALFVKALLPEKGEWDGKWRMILFDIPERASSERGKLRRLLLKNGFKLLQKSVYISPYALNTAAIEYLRQTGWDKYIRIFRIDQADNEKALKAQFSFTHSTHGRVWNV